MKQKKQKDIEKKEEYNLIWMMDEQAEFKKIEAQKNPELILNAPWKVSEIEFLNYETENEGIKELVNAIPSARSD